MGFGVHLVPLPVLNWRTTWAVGVFGSFGRDFGAGFCWVLEATGFRPWLAL